MLTKRMVDMTYRYFGIQKIAYEYGIMSLIMKRLFWALIFTIYSAFLIKIMVFKDIPTIRLGHLMFNFGGTETGGGANFLPFKTILQYFLGDKGLIIGGINLVGNIALLVPIGFIVPLVYQNMTWKKSLILAVTSGLLIEGMQVILQIGIFDIDDVILNGLGVIIGYWIYKTFNKLMNQNFA